MIGTGAEGCRSGNGSSAVGALRSVASPCDTAIAKTGQKVSKLSGNG